MKSVDKIGDLASSSASAATQLEATTKSISRTVDGARQTSERVSATARDGGHTVAQSIAGLTRFAAPWRSRRAS